MKQHSLASIHNVQAVIARIDLKRQFEAWITVLKTTFTLPFGAHQAWL